MAAAPKARNNSTSTPPPSGRAGTGGRITANAALQSSLGKLRPLVVSVTFVGEVVAAWLRAVVVALGLAPRSAAKQAETMGAA
jgi:hypothetical protein